MSVSFPISSRWPKGANLTQAGTDRLKAKYWFRTYRIDRAALIENNRSCLKKIWDVLVPSSIHGELNGHCLYENGSKVFLVAKDGFRIRSENKQTDRIEALAID